VPIDPSSVSVVIPAFRNQVVLDRTLATLLAQTVKAREIIVVDDGSETPLKVPKGVTLARIERKATYRGSSDAKNHGAALATGDYLAFSDSDILHMPDAIESVLAHFVKCENPRMLVNVFSLAMEAKPDALVFDMTKSDHMETLLAHYEKLGKRYDRLVLGLPAKGWLPSINVKDDGYDSMCFSEQHFGVMRRDFFNELGGYDAYHFTSWGLNNQDLSIRVAKAGGGKLSSNVRRVKDGTLLHCFHQHNPGEQNGPTAKAEFRAKYGRNFTPQILVGG